MLHPISGVFIGHENIKNCEEKEKEKKCCCPSSY
jgi:hypothetical protein